MPCLPEPALVLATYLLNAPDPVLLASRVEVLPGRAASQTSAAPPGPSTIYFYIGLDCSAAADSGDEDPCSEALEAGEEDVGGLVVVDSDSKPRQSLLVRGRHPQHGVFELESTVVSTRDENDVSPSSSGGGGDTTRVAFLGRKGVPMVDIKREVEKLHEAHRRMYRANRRGGKNEMAERVPFALPDESDVGSNVVLVQVRDRVTPQLVCFRNRKSTVLQLRR